MNTGNGPIGHSRTAPTRPPLPDAEKLAAFRKRQEVKACLGKTPRKMSAADAKQTKGLSLKSETNPDINKKNGFSIKERAISKLQNTKARLAEKYDNLKEKATIYNDARKSWQQAPVDNTIDTVRMSAGYAHEKLKAKKHATKEKMATMAGSIKGAYNKSRAGIEVWRSAKKDVTLAVAADLYSSAKNKAIRKSKALKNYVIKKVDNGKMKLSTLIATLKKSNEASSPNKSLSSRKSEKLP